MFSKHYYILGEFEKNKTMTHNTASNVFWKPTKKRDYSTNIK